MTSTTPTEPEALAALEPILNAIAKSGKVEAVDYHHIAMALSTPARTDDAGVGGVRLALSAIKVITATVKTPDVPRALARIMAIARWAGIEAPYSELQKDERVAFLVSNATREEGRAMLAALSPAPDRGEVDADEGPCTDCDDTGITIQTERRCACQPPLEQPRDEKSALAELIRTRLLGVDPDDQDLQLEDDDWRLILTALKPADATPAGEAVQMEARFLLDRLSELEWMDDGYREVQRDFFGHVEPAMARLRAALQSGEGKA